MPLIDFGSEDAQLGASGWDRLESVMCFPKSEGRRQAYLHGCHDRVGYKAESAARWADHEVELTRREQFPESPVRPSVLNSVWTSIGHAKHHDGGFRISALNGTRDSEEGSRSKASQRGRIAGFMLICLISPSHQKGDRNVSIGRAEFVARKWLENYRQLDRERMIAWETKPNPLRFTDQRELLDRQVSSGSATEPERLISIPIGEKSVRESWQAFKCVSHFWAAEILAEQQDRFSDVEAEGQTSLGEFLGWSQRILDRAVSVGVEGVTTEQAWVPPVEAITTSLALSIPPLPVWISEVLTDYRRAK